MLGIGLASRESVKSEISGSCSRLPVGISLQGLVEEACGPEKFKDNQCNVAYLFPFCLYECLQNTQDHG
jgi:hypothetical protein